MKILAYKKINGRNWFYASLDKRVCPFDYLYSAVTTKQKLLRWVYKIIGNFFLGKQKLITKRSIPDSMLEPVKDLVTCQRGFAVFLGTPGADTKNVWFIPRLGYVKVPSGSLSYELIKNEYVSYKYLFKSDVADYLTVNSIEDIEFSGNRLILKNDTPHEERVYSARLTSYSKFFSVMSAQNNEEPLRSVDTRELNLTKHLLSNADLVGLKHFRLIEAAIKLVKTEWSKSSVEYGPSHGDFVPWNCFFDHNKNLKVFDWERFSSSRLAFWDIVYFEISVGALLERRRNPKEMVRSIKACIESVSGSVRYSQDSYISFLILQILAERIKLINQSEMFAQQAWFVDKCLKMLKILLQVRL